MAQVPDQKDKQDEPKAKKEQPTSQPILVEPETPKDLDIIDMSRVSDLVSARALEDELVEKGKEKDVYEQLAFREKSEYLEFRKKWSTALLVVVYLIVLFNMLFLVLVGLGVIKFTDEWLVRIIFIGSFVEVIGLAKIVVDFLFKEPPKS